MAVIKPKEIDDFSTLSDTIKIGAVGSDSFGYSSIDYGAIPPMSISDLTLGNITVGSTTTTTNGTTYTLGSGIGLTGSNAVWTTTGTGTGSAIGGLWNTPASIDQGGKISLKGEKADVDINGKSLVQWMEAMEERMNWMQPNVELEKEWDDLKKLGDRYRKLEKKCREKAEVWKKLKSMPKPEIE